MRRFGASALKGKRGLLLVVMTMAVMLGAYLAGWYTWEMGYQVEPLTYNIEYGPAILSGATFGDAESEMESLYLEKNCTVHFVVTAVETERLAGEFHDLQLVLVVIGEDYLLGAVELDLVKEGVPQGTVDESIFLWGEMDYYVYGWLEYWTGALVEPVSGNITVSIYAVQAEGPKWLYVGEGGYGSIQAAINAASDGDWIYVEYGEYFENVVVNKSVTLISEGAMINAAGNGNGFLVLADDVKIMSFEIYDAVGYQTAGILLGSIGTTWSGSPVTVSDCLITMNYIENCSNGIYLWNSSSNFILANEIYESTDLIGGVPQYIFGNGIILWDGGKDNKVSWNDIEYCDRWGIFLGANTAVEMDGNKVHENGLYGNGMYSYIPPGNWYWLGIGVMNAQGPITITDNYIEINATATENALWIQNSSKVYCARNEIVEVYP